MASRSKSRDSDLPRTFLEIKLTPNAVREKISSSEKVDNLHHLWSDNENN